MHYPNPTYQIDPSHVKSIADHGKNRLRVFLIILPKKYNNLSFTIQLYDNLIELCLDH